MRSMTLSVNTVPSASENLTFDRRDRSAGRATSPARMGSTVDSM